MQFNWKALTKTEDDICYTKPGFEECGTMHLSSHNLYKLIDEDELKKGITSIPRIRPWKDEGEVKDFCSLEHRHIRKYIGQSEHYQTYDFDSFYYTPIMLTALSQRFHPFRKSVEENIEVYLMKKNNSLHFCQNIGSEWKSIDEIYDINLKEINNSSFNDWLNLSYTTLVSKYSQLMDKHEEEIEKIYGELCFANTQGRKWKYTNRFGLEEINDN